MLPCLLFEDDHLLVVNKPAGLNTHSPGPFAGEGLYDWLRHREPRWADLAIHQRLDKETSGVLLFSKTAVANKSLADQFARRVVRKTYWLLTDRPVTNREVTVRTALVRAGAKYIARPIHTGGETAETRFRLPSAADTGVPRTSIPSGCHWVIAEPLTGRTHQIRVHAANEGFPILGDTLYSGTAASRLCLHAAELSLRHPLSGQPITFSAPVEFLKEPRLQLRTRLIDTEETTACRIIHGASDGWPGWYVERLGDFLYSQSESELTQGQLIELRYLMDRCSARGACHKHLTRHVRGASVTQASPKPVLGAPAPERFTIRENSLRFELSFSEGYSVGLFLDQRDNRRRLFTGHAAAGFTLRSPAEVLNTFAYTCAFSVCAAHAGARVTSLDLSKKYLEWGRRNFVLNGLDPERHDFIFGDAFDWLRRLAKKDRQFDLILLDPPTFSQSRESGLFRADKDYGRLVAAALPLLKREGILFASTNASDWAPDLFLASIQGATRTARREILRAHYVPQPPDFPISPAEPAYLKTAWLQIR